MTEIKICNCDHDQQDKMYGEQRRVMNKLEKANKWRCTVCNKEQSS